MKSGADTYKGEEREIAETNVPRALWCDDDEGAKGEASRSREINKSVARKERSRSVTKSFAWILTVQRALDYDLMAWRRHALSLPRAIKPEHGKSRTRIPEKIMASFPPASYVPCNRLRFACSCESDDILSCPAYLVIFFTDC